MKSPVLLRVYYKDELIEVKQFTENQIVIGRAESVQIKLNNDQVAPLHALIEERDNGYYVADLGAESGILKDEKKVLDEPLNSGDHIFVGPYKIEFFIGVPKPKAPPKVEEENKVFPQLPAETNAEPASDAMKVKEVKESSRIPEPPPVLKKEELKTFESKTEKPAEEISPPDEKKLDLVSELHEGPMSEGSEDEVPPPSIPEKSPPAGKETPSKSKDKSSKKKLSSKEKSNEFPHKKKFTFAPKGSISDLETHLKPGEGNNVEVLVSWQDRILTSHFYSANKKSVTVGSLSVNDLVIPFGQKNPIVVFNGGPKIQLSPEMRATIIKRAKSDISRSNISGPTQIDLKQNEIIKVEFSNEPIVLFIRYASESQKPIAAPLLDLNLSDLTTLVFTFVVAAIFGVYMFIYAPIVEEEPIFEEPIRRAVVKFRPPKITPIEKEKIKVKETKSTTKKSAKKSIVKKVDPGKAKAVAKVKKPKSRKKKLTSAKPGGSIKTGKKSGATAKTVKKDPTELGFLGALSGKGIQKELSKTSSGSGELLGLAEKSTGYSGMKANRPGAGLGTSLKSVGKSGKGSSTVGIGDIKTGGTGKGLSGIGTGVVGKRAKINFQLGGDEEDFVGKIDRDAVKRVILANKRSFRFCYNKELKSNSSLYGKIVLQWDIIEGGRVRNVVVVKNTIGSKRLAKCVGNRLKGLKFPEPPPESEAVVRFPFVFSSQ